MGLLLFSTQNGFIERTNNKQLRSTLKIHDSKQTVSNKNVNLKNSLIFNKWD